MARTVDYKASNDIGVHILKETTVGTGLVANMKKYQATSFSIPEASVPVAYASARSGHFTAVESMAQHDEGTKMWTFDVTLRGTPEAMKLACDSVFEDDSSVFALNNDYSFPTATYKDAYNDGSLASTFTVFFNNGGLSDSLDHIYLQGCVGTGFTVNQAVGSESGEATITINFATGYMPQYTDTALGGTTTYDTGVPKNIKNLHHANCFVKIASDKYEQTVHSWDLSVSRTIERVGFADTTAGSFKPHGYAMTGPFEVTGNMSVVRNTNVGNIRGRWYGDSNDCAIKIGASSGFLIDAPLCFINEPSVDTGGAMLMETLPFTVVGADDISSSTAMLSITWA